jgi:hypothetical protein
MEINNQKSSITLSNLSEEDSLLISTRLPFRVFDLDEGLKYLGFQLKPNDYRKTDWWWLIAKLEKRLKCWSHRWLSRAGRLVLVKAVLEAIPVYWMSLAWIPKGILEKMRKMCFLYLWQGHKDKKVLPWVRWDRIATPKSLGGWGLKNIFSFSKALAAKCTWRLIKTYKSLDTGSSPKIYCSSFYSRLDSNYK